MTQLESLRIAFAALSVNRLRSVLTLLGIIIGVASVITIISALEGLMAGIEQQMSVLGPQTFVVTKFGLITDYDDFLKALKKKDLTLEDRRAIEAGCPDCEAVGASNNATATIKRGSGGLRNVNIDGSTANMINILSFEIAEGRYFTQDEYDRKNQVAFVGPTIVEELFPGVDPIGKTIKINGRKFTVVGVAKKRGAFLDNNQDNFVSIPLSTHSKIFGKPRNFLDLIVKSRTLEGMADTQDQVRAILRARRGVPYKDDDDFAILTAENVLSFVDKATKGVRVALIAISSIALVVGGIVIMNIMMVSVTERTREIGIRKSIGARRKHILTQFLYEALILSLGGGIIGTALGIGLAIFLGAKISLPISPSVFAIVCGISISTGVGVFFGMYPAVKASQLDPIAALRFE